MQPTNETTTTATDAAPGASTSTGTDVMSVEGATETILETIRGIWTNFLSHVPYLLMGLLVLAVTAAAAFAIRRVVRSVVSSTSMRTSLKELIERLSVVTIWVLGVLLSFMVVFPNLSPTDALAALGVGSIAIGLAFKDIFENMLAGVLILWRFPFEDDDFIECNGQMGRVETVQIRNTILRTVDGELVVVPNAEIYKNVVQVLTHEEHRRVRIICGVGYGEDVAEARRVIKRAVTSCDSVNTSKSVEIFAQEFADSSINFEIAWWTGATPLEQRASRDEVVEAVKSALDENDIEIPFPYRTLTFPETLSIKGLSGTDGEEETRSRDEYASASAN